MSSTNPFALGGWSNPGNPASPETPEHRIYANMPISNLQSAQPFQNYHFIGTRPSFSTLRFVHARPPAAPGTPVDVLNSVVVDDQTRALLFLSTATNPSTNTTVTAVTNPQGAGIGLVEWSLHPFGALAGIFQRQLVSTILQIRSQTTVAMVIRGRTYQWARNPGDSQLYFYDTAFTPPELLTVVSRETTGLVTVSVSPFVATQNLTEAVIFSAALLMSGRPLD